MLNVQSRQEGTASVLTIRGALTFESLSALRDAMRKTITDNHSQVLVLNLEGVNLIDSSGIGLLVAFQKNVMTSNQGSLRLCCLGPNLHKALDSVNVSQFFSVYPSEQEALHGAAL